MSDCPNAFSGLRTKFQGFSFYLVTFDNLILQTFSFSLQYWCTAFMDLGFQTTVTTTNGVETLNKSLKHFYLKLASTGTLSSLLDIVINNFLPDLFQNYLMLNYRYVLYESICIKFLIRELKHILFWKLS
jgi:hypothetical protein